MSRSILFAATVALAAGTLATAAARADAVVGQPAPAFTLTDSQGKTHSLKDFAGKTVVLEWTNNECPFVKKHYDGKNMQAQQGEAKDGGVVWLVLNSSASGKQGHVTAEQANAIQAKWGARQAAYLFDTPGTVGRAYGAKTTPHMYVIDGQGILRYNGAIDSNPSSDPKDIPGATQYVRAALADLMAGKAVATPTTRPYGCSIKY
jgi:peroxiredoxin